MAWVWTEYSGNDDEALLPLLISERTQQLLLAALNDMSYRNRWSPDDDDSVWDEIDAQIAESTYEIITEVSSPIMDFTPVGVVVMYGHHTTLPEKWLFCWGQEVDIDDYPELYASIGWAYGSPSIETKFKLPNMVDRFPLGADASDFSQEIGNTGGTETHTLTIAELPAHNHTIAKAVSTGSSATQAAPGGGGTGTTQNTGSQGSGSAHNNMPPFLRIEFIIKALP